MQQFHLQEEETVRYEKMSQEEADDVVRLWAEHERQRAAGITVGSVAEGLEIPAAEAHRLLQIVRQQRSETQTTGAVVEPRRRATYPIEKPLMAAFAAGVFLSIVANTGLLMLACIVGMIATLAVHRRWAGLAATVAALFALGMLFSFRMMASQPEPPATVAVESPAPVPTPDPPREAPTPSPSNLSGPAPTMGGGAASSTPAAGTR